MSLFEADDYTAPGRTPNRPRTRTPPQPREVVPIMITQRWRYVHRSQPGIVHCASHVDDKRGVLVTTFCGLVGTPLTFTLGETANGCATCIQRGAPT